MATLINALAGHAAPPSVLIDLDKLVAAYHAHVPDPTVAVERVAFGTSGHRGSAFDRSFNEWHVLAITQAICLYRKAHGVDGPLFLGLDTHAISQPAGASALEVLAANGVEVMLAINDEYTPTPAISHAILTHNRHRTSALADGIVMTPSHNPPRDGGLKYNPPHGGPASGEVTRWIEAAANRFLEAQLRGVLRIPHAKAMAAVTTDRHDFVTAFVSGLGTVIDMDVIRSSNIRIGVDPLGGAGVHYWNVIAETYGLNMTVVSDVVDPTFSFMPLDWVARCLRHQSASNGSWQACWTARWGFAARKAPAPHSCAVTVRCGRLTKTASAPRCSPLRSQQAQAETPVSCMSIWRMNSATRCQIE